jgi:hypothetical protein
LFSTSLVFCALAARLERVRNDIEDHGKVMVNFFNYFQMHAPAMVVSNFGYFDYFESDDGGL